MPSSAPSTDNASLLIYCTDLGCFFVGFVVVRFSMFDDRVAPMVEPGCGEYPVSRRGAGGWW